MLELLEKIDILKKALNETDLIKRLESAQLEILNDSQLYQKIKNRDVDISSNLKVVEYRKVENEVNFLILEINDYLKRSFKESQRCHHESN